VNDINICGTDEQGTRTGVKNSMSGKIYQISVAKKGN